MTQGTRFARNLVVVTKSDTTSVRYERNAFADPQLLISVSTTGSIERKYVQEIADLIVRQELKNGIGQLRRQHNRLAEEKTRKLLGCSLWVPEDLAKMKEGHDFLWLSNDAARGMQNVCIYRYSAKMLSANLVRQKTDSILQANIPGEREGTWMQLVSQEALQEDTTLCMRGLWEVKGDAMGGPYVSLSILQGDSIITALAFVYAPEQRKRNIIRRLEAALYTMKREY